MRSKEQNMVPSPSPSSSETQVKKGFQSTNATPPTTAPSCGSHRSHFSHYDESDSFYFKLTHLLDSTGLTLILNVRETLLDLYLLYLEVTTRGGFLQVGIEKKWGEVVSALNLDGSNVELSDRVEKLYAHLLFQFEQLYFYRSHSKQAAAASSIEGPLKRKWSVTASFSPIMNVQDGRSLTKICKDHSSQTTGAAFVEQSVILPAVPPSNGKAPSNGKEKKKRAGTPVGSSGYQIFLKKECDRLKTCGQVPDGTSIFRIAVDAWNKMSETEKMPYLEESKKNKERLKEAMITNSKQQNTMEKRPSECGDDCHVTLQPETDNSLVNTQMTENAPKNPLFLCEFDPYYIH